MILQGRSINPYMAAKNPGKNPFRTTLIAPCGINCAVCSAFLREKNRCPGCASANHSFRRHCSIAACSEIKARYRHGCGNFPCRRLKQLDLRYRTRYHVSMLENIDAIRRLGVRVFVKSERERWTCRHCGGTIDMHHNRCSACGAVPGEG